MTSNGWTRYEIPQNRVASLWVVLLEADEADVAFGIFVSEADAEAWVRAHPSQQTARVMPLLPPQ